jgi:hypothetical protein
MGLAAALIGGRSAKLAGKHFLGGIYHYSLSHLSFSLILVLP